MTHIVIHDDLDAVTQYRRFDEQGDAVAYLEELRNTSGVDDAKLFTLDEVKFEVKQYFKVEVLDSMHSSIDDPVPAPVVESLQKPEVLPTAEDVTYVEAAMQEPIEATATEATESEMPPPPVGFEDPIEGAVPSGANDGRRGLFGR